MGSELQVKYQALAQEYAKVFYIYFSGVLKFAQLHIASSGEVCDFSMA